MTGIVVIVVFLADRRKHVQKLVASSLQEVCATPSPFVPFCLTNKCIKKLQPMTNNAVDNDWKWDSMIKHNNDIAIITHRRQEATNYFL